MKVSQEDVSDSGVAGLLLCPDGSISVRGKVFSQVDEILDSLPDDWAIHKPLGAGEIVRCKRGDGLIKRFQFRGGTWYSCDSPPDELVALVEIVQPSVAELGSKSVAAAYERNCCVAKGECLHGEYLAADVFGDLRLHPNGAFSVGNRTFDGEDAVDGEIVGGNRLYRWDGANAFLIVESPSGSSVVFHDGDLGWYRLTKGKTSSKVRRLAAFLALSQAIAFGLPFLAFQFLGLFLIAGIVGEPQTRSVLIPLTILWFAIDVLAFLVLWSGIGFLLSIERNAALVLGAPSRWTISPINLYPYFSRNHPSRYFYAYRFVLNAAEFFFVMFSGRPR
jgi:hypothetical protein